MIVRACIFLTISVVAFGQPPAPAQATASRDLAVTVGKSVLVDSVPNIERVSVANGDLAEAVAITPHEVLVNGKAAGETSLIVWQQGGNRLFFDLTIQRNEARVDAIRREIMEELGNQDVTIELQDTTVFVRGTVKNLSAANRAIQIASTLGRPVNLLRVAVPETDAQILLKVKFADVDRSTAEQLGINFFSTGNTPGTVSTGQFSPPRVDVQPGSSSTVTLTQALNVFLFRPDLNLGATIAALQSKNLLQILAEPNVLAINGHNASFLAGGEFPYPTLQGGGAGLGAVTIQFREFGVRINFTPVITPRGTIRLAVTPEVSSLDYANGLVFQGFTIPGLSTRRVQTEIELNDGQSFAIGGLLDNRDTETFNRIPGLGDIPFFGKLFRSRQLNRSNTELIVMVTPELVRPIPRGQATPELNRPGKFLPPNTSSTPPQTPGPEVTGAVALSSAQEPIPVEDLLKSIETPEAPTQAAPQIQYVPVPLLPAPQGGQPAPQNPAPATLPPGTPAPNQNPQGR
jgi:pilus assembly protein CpaC